MLPNQHQRGAEGNGASGLESQLRNMILTNASTNAHANQNTNPAGTPSTSSRRRPNQAQRRQMSQPFTVTPEPRQQLPQYSHATRANTQWPPQQQSRSTSGPGPSDFPRSRNSWNGPPQAPANRPQYQNPSTMRQYNAAPSHGAHHQSAGSFHYQHRSIRPEELESQARLLDMLCHQVLAHSEIDRSEIAEKEAFRQRIEHICREVISQFEVGQFEGQQDVNRIPPFSVELKCFGSLSSGFATKASDLDLGLVSPLSKIPPDAPGSPIPRLIEKAFLQAGLGARLLSRTRVPIIKICELPPEDLFKSLLEAREKWERGIDKETQSGAAEIEPDNDGSVRGEDEDHEQSGVAEAGSDSLGEFEILCKDSTEPQRFRLQQGPKNSLDSYYGLAKRILRRAGGYDITASNCKDFTAADWDILNRVCYAFVQGLADDSLRDHVARLPSIAAANARSNSLDHRSLFGIFMQVEGENILRRWKLWREGLPLRQPEDDRAIRQWESLQLRSLPDIEPVTYNRDLQLALEKLKKIPSVQVLMFEQDQQETPSQYYTRIRSIVNSLGGSVSAPQSTITSRYVAGIFDEEIRDQLGGYLEQFPEQATIQAVGCRHKSIHLANEFERAIESNLYDAAVVPAIKRYIEILRQPLEKRMMAPGKPYYVVSIPAEFSSDFGKIKTLTDPHTMTPNQLGQRQRDPLEFPKSDVGVQCDINFSAHLALQNTLLLRCYSHTDPRVRPMILFVKHWAKMRGINSGYRGTLSSYGYVLMVLHYLVNVAQPFVCPNLQQLAPAPPNNLTPAEIQSTISCRGYNIQFWRNEEEIIRLASQNQLNRNTESVGHLLRGFFEYFAQTGMMGNGLSRGFDWGRNVISLRTHGGILTKQEKGWTGAKTVYEVQKTDADASHPLPRPDTQPPASPQATKNREVKEIRLRYLFAIEDPFEIDHNVARTVTHNGIVSIRNEFRRAWRILRAAGNGNGNGNTTQENLLQDVEDEKEVPVALLQLLADIHEPIPV
ncbi:hypothetical protein THARTR1_06545 [Trichoderma harzianum]|uniref:polynucleotide adenylyltransferase n=1 Tax=Trichoderma harzianum TaxID=5544 RepID=A0A2K0U5I9_TRIHA|nr:hypothetical protein THARTR1_06545 [Trichoderma harzianum]